MKDNKNRFSIEQKSFFPWVQKRVEVDVRENQAKISFSAMTKKREVTVKLDEIDANAEKFSCRAYGWMASLILFSLLDFGYLVLGVSYTPLLFLKAWVLGLFLLTGTLISLYFYISRTFDVLLYVTISRQMSFDFWVNKPNKQAYEAFISRFDEAIAHAQKRRELFAIIQGISTDFLKEDFSVFYVEALLRNGVDVNYLLDSTKRAFLASYVSEHVIGRTLN